MNIWTAAIKVRNAKCRIVVALIAGYAVTMLAGIVFTSILRWIGPPSAKSMWLVLLFYLSIVSFVPMYVTLWVYWEMTPDCKASSWTRYARLLAATGGTVIEATLYILVAVPLANAQLLSAAAGGLILIVVSFGLAGVAAIWLFGVLSARQTRRRRQRGLCVKCGYDLTGDVTGTCPECGVSSTANGSQHVSILALFGLSLSAAVAALFVITRNHSCGYWSRATVLGFDHGALLIHFDPLTYEGWFWSTFSFIPMSGYVWWPIFTESTVLIPLWIVFLSVFIPSFLLWRRSRKPLPGYCQKCGYNLTGLTEPRCPKCATEFDPAILPQNQPGLGELTDSRL